MHKRSLAHPARAAVLPLLFALSACVAPAGTGTAATGAGSGAAAQTAACPPVGSWYDPASRKVLTHQEVLAGLADKAVVLLGEKHDDPEHHRWQLSVASSLLARQGRLALGFEAFPREVQPTLDTWVRGELTSEGFLQQARWSEVWGFEPDLYRPLFDFARLYRLPMAALNVDRALIGQVAQKGWASVPEAERQGVGDPAPATDAYRQNLAEVFALHGRSPDKPGDAEADKAALEAVYQRPEFQRFVEAQLAWDRAMAEALAAAHRKPGNPTVVGIIGSGHLQYGYGVPHQLAALGITDVAVLLPVGARQACDNPDAELADRLFVLDQRPVPAPVRPRLGVFIETVEGGARVREVTQGSVAAAAKLEAGDIIRAAAGFELADHRQLIEIVGRQSAGTWLPLTVERNGKRFEAVAKFPTAFE